MPPKSLTERLVDQKLQYHRKEHEGFYYIRRLAQQAAEKQTLQEKVDSVKEQKDKLEQLKLKMLEANEGVRKLLQSDVDDDERQRKELSNELSASITAVNTRVEEETREHATVLHENARLKEQIGVLESNLSSGDEKYTHVVAARDKEVDAMKTQVEKETEIEKMLQERLEQQTPQLSALTELHDELAKIVEAYVGRFAEVQKKLGEAKNIFDTSKAENERLARRIHNSEEDYRKAVQRLEVSIKENLTETQNVSGLTKQLKAVEEQTEKFKKVTENLTQKVKEASVGGAEPNHVDPVAA